MISICTGCVHLLRHTCGGLVHENVKVVYNASADTGVVTGSDKLISYYLGKWASFTWRIAKQRKQVH